MQTVMIDGKRYRITEQKLVTAYPATPQGRKAKNSAPYRYMAAWAVPVASGKGNGPKEDGDAA